MSVTLPETTIASVSMSASSSAYLDLTNSNCTRVLELFPKPKDRVSGLFSKSKDRDDRLYGKLIEIDLDDPPEYEAISYVWGQRRDVGKILCSTPTGTLEEISLTGNGEDILRRLQGLKSSRLLWIDSICINQKSKSERSSQVAIMSKIYSKARRTLIWLPNDDAEDWKDFKPTYLNACIRRTGRRRSRVRALLEGYNRTEIIGLHGEDRYPIEMELCRIRSSAWFSRVWTVQEFAFSKDCELYFSGESPLSASKLAGEWQGFHVWNSSVSNHWPHNPFKSDSILALTRSNVKHHQHGSRMPSDLVADLGTSQQEWFFTANLNSMLSSYRELNATEAIDHVYAIYSVLLLDQDLARSLPKLDYNKTKDEIFRATTVAILKSERSLYLLVGLPSVQHSTLEATCPSWVPDYSQKARQALAEDTSRNPIIDFVPAFTFSDADRVLVVPGLLMDHVSFADPSHKTIQHDRHNGNTTMDQNSWVVFLSLYNLFFESDGSNVRLLSEFIACIPRQPYPVHVQPHMIVILCILYLLESISTTSGYKPLSDWFDKHFPETDPRTMNSKNWNINELEFESVFPALVPLQPECIEQYAALLAEVCKEGFNGLQSRSEPWQGSIPSGKPMKERFLIFLNRSCIKENMDLGSIFIGNEFFITDRGHIGFTNGYVEAGDCTILVPTLDRPIVVRKDEDRRGYTYVGAAAIARPWEEIDTLGRADIQEFRLV